MSLQSMSDCWIAHSTMPCVRSAPVRLAPVPRRPRDVPSQAAIAHAERFVMVLSGCHLYLAHAPSHRVLHPVHVHMYMSMHM